MSKKFVAGKCLQDFSKIIKKEGNLKKLSKKKKKFYKALDSGHVLNKRGQVKPAANLYDDGDGHNIIIFKYSKKEFEAQIPSKKAMKKTIGNFVTLNTMLQYFSVATGSKPATQDYFGNTAVQLIPYEKAAKNLTKVAAKTGSISKDSGKNNKKNSRTTSSSYGGYTLPF